VKKSSTTTSHSKRISRDNYFMTLAKVAALRSTCLRRSVGCVLVRENRVIATGYNGTPRGIEHCESRGCLRKKLNIKSGERHEICRGLHAEENVIIQCALTGTSTKDSILYCTTRPCSICSKNLINAKVSEIVYLEEYPDKLATQILKESTIILRRMVWEKVALG
jgi:dCMP deaminase